MKSFLTKFMAIAAIVTLFAACKEEPTTKYTYGGKDSDGDYLTLNIDEATSSYELYYGESKKDTNYTEFSAGTYVLKASVSSDDKQMECSDKDGETKFTMIVASDGKKVSYNNGDGYSFTLSKK